MRSEESRTSKADRKQCKSRSSLVGIPTLVRTLLLSLLVLTYFLDFPSPEYANMIKRLCRKLLHTFTGSTVRHGVEAEGSLWRPVSAFGEVTSPMRCAWLPLLPLLCRPSQIHVEGVQTIRSRLLSAISYREVSHLTCLRGSRRFDSIRFIRLARARQTN